MSEMKRIYRREGKGTLVWDPEMSYLDLFEENGEKVSFSLSNAWEDLRAESLEYVDEHFVTNPDEKPWRETYQERTGQEFPPLYKIRVTIEVEALSDDEVRNLWEARRQRRSRSTEK